MIAWSLFTAAAPITRHPERSEGSGRIFRCAQDDRHLDSAGLLQAAKFRRMQGIARGNRSPVRSKVSVQLL